MNRIKLIIVIILVIFPKFLFAGDKIHNLGLYNYEWKEIQKASLSRLEKLSKDDSDKFILAIAYLSASRIGNCFFDSEDMGKMIHGQLKYLLKTEDGKDMSYSIMGYYISKSFPTIVYIEDRLEGLHNLGMLKFDNRDEHGNMQEGKDENHYKKAYDYFLKAANKGFAPSQLMLGVMYTRGTYVKKDMKEGVKWFELAIKSSDKIGKSDKYRGDEAERIKKAAHYALGMIYEFYFKDFKKARNHFEKIGYKNEIRQLDARFNGVNDEYIKYLKSADNDSLEHFILANIYYQKDGGEKAQNEYENTRDHLNSQCFVCIDLNYPCVIQRSIFMLGIQEALKRLKRKREYLDSYFRISKNERGNLSKHYNNWAVIDSFLDMSHSTGGDMRPYGQMCENRTDFKSCANDIISTLKGTRKKYEDYIIDKELLNKSYNILCSLSEKLKTEKKLDIITNEDYNKMHLNDMVPDVCLNNKDALKQEGLINLWKYIDKGNY